MKRFNVTLIFSKGGCYTCKFCAVSKEAAKAQAIEWAKQCGFYGSIKAEIIELGA